MARTAACPPAYAASMSLASWPVTTEVVSSSSAIALPWLAAERVPAMPMAATAAATRARPTHTDTSELVAARARVRIQLMVMDNLLMQIIHSIKHLCGIEGKRSLLFPLDRGGGLAVGGRAHPGCLVVPG